MKIYAPTVVANTLLFAALISASAYAKTASEIYEQAAKSTVVVGNFDAKGKQQSMGSGVVMPDGDVVTNCHVVKGASRLTVRVGQTERPATLRYSDWDRDVCALSSTGLNAPSATVGSSKTLKVGAKVYAIGAPKGLELTLSDGIVSSLRDLDGGRYIQTTAAISPGSSGGGLYDDTGALVGLTTFYFAEGQSLNFAVPIDWVKDLPKRSIKTLQTTQASIAWLSKSIELENIKNWPAMLTHSLNWTKAQPNSDQAWYVLGLTHNRTKQHIQAISAYQQALRFNPENNAAWYNLGIAYNDSKQHAQAISAYQQALRINPEFAAAWYNLGNTYIDSKQHPQAINAYQQALRIDPEHANAWYNLGKIYKDTQQYPQAISAFQQALRINPEAADAWMSLGNTYNDLQQYPLAINAYQQALRINPEDDMAWYNIGLIYANTKQHPQAINALEQALRIKPEFANTWYALGNTYLETKQYSQAINAYQQAVRIYPEFAKAWNNLGISYHILGNRAKMMEAYKKLRVLDPVQADKYFNTLISPGG